MRIIRPSSCPAWCTADHTTIPSHATELHGCGDGSVTLLQHPGQPPAVMIAAATSTAPVTATVDLTAAVRLAEVLAHWGVSEWAVTAIRRAAHVAGQPGGPGRRN